MGDDIGFLDMEGIRTAVEWARREGWNPGLGDAEAFAAQDPEGFLGLKVDGELAATISLVNYGASFGFPRLLHSQARDARQPAPRRVKARHRFRTRRNAARAPFSAHG